MAAWDVIPPPPERMMRNVEASHGLYNSQEVMLSLARKGMTREEAYRVVQELAMRSWKEDRSFLELLKASADVTAKLSQAELDGIFDLGMHTRHAGEIFRRVFGDTRG